MYIIIYHYACKIYHFTFISYFMFNNTNWNIVKTSFIFLVFSLMGCLTKKTCVTIFIENVIQKISYFIRFYLSYIF